MPRRVQWTPLLAKTALAGDIQNAFAIESARRVTHLRLNIFPDGGVARLRVHGEVVPDSSIFTPEADLEHMHACREWQRLLAQPKRQSFMPGLANRPRAAIGDAGSRPDDRRCR